MEFSARTLTLIANRDCGTQNGNRQNSFNLVANVIIKHGVQHSIQQPATETKST